MKTLLFLLLILLTFSSTPILAQNLPRFPQPGAGWNDTPAESKQRKQEQDIQEQENRLNNIERRQNRLEWEQRQQRDLDKQRWRERNPFNQSTPENPHGF